jgi:anti-anti-sigma factor
MPLVIDPQPLNPSQPATQHIYLNGSLDTDTAASFEEFLGEVLPEVATLILHLEKLSFISSAGLRVFAKARKMMKGRSGTVCFVSLSPQVQRVFEIVKAVPIHEVFQNEAELDAYLADMQKDIDAD